MSKAKKALSYSKKRLGWRRVLLLFCLLFVLFLGWALAKSVLRPIWYQPTAIDHRAIEGDKADLVGLYESISESLNRGQRARIEVSEAQLNRWARSRAEIWPDFDRELGEFRDPQIRLLDGNQIEFAASYRLRGWPSVPAVRLELGVEDRISCRLQGLTIGRLALPVSMVWPTIRDRIEAENLHRVSIGERGLQVFNEWIWDNGKVPFRVSSLEITSGRAIVELARLPRGVADAGS
ncbi:MAG: hypothetical protein AB7N71_04410 [Phycisphaerae bacterium]